MTTNLLGVPGFEALDLGRSVTAAARRRRSTTSTTVTAPRGSRSRTVTAERGSGGSSRTVTASRGGGSSRTVTAEREQAKTRTAVADRLNKMDVTGLKRLVSAQHSRLDREHKSVQSEHDRIADEVDKEESEGRTVSAARKKQRRMLAAKSVAAFVRRQRTNAAKKFLERAEKEREPKKREAFRRAAIAAMKARIRARKGKFSVECGSADGDAMNGFGAFGYAGNHYWGESVPQVANPLLQDVVGPGLRAAIQQATLPANFTPPNRIEVPSAIRLPGIAAAQPELPDFRPGLRTAVNPPNYLTVNAPAISRGPQSVPAIPAASQHPLQQRMGLPDRGRAAPPAIPELAPTAKTLRIPGQTEAPPPGARGGLSPRQGATVVPPSVTPGTGSQTSGSIEVERMKARSGVPTNADMGFMGYDPIVDDVAGVFGMVVGGAEREHEDDMLDLLDQKGLLGDFGQTPRGQKRLKRIRARRKRRKARLQKRYQRAVGRGKTRRAAKVQARGLRKGFRIGMKHKLRAHKVKAAAGLDEALVGAGLKAASQVDPQAGLPTGSFANQVAGALADKQVDRESRLASEVGAAPDQSKRRRRRAKIIAAIRRRASSPQPC